MTGEILTARLRLRPSGRRDVGELRDLFELPEVRRYLFDDQRVEVAWVERAIEDSRRLFESIGCGLYVAMRLDRQGILGFTGFREFLEPPQLQLLYGLRPDAWGHGFATEMTRAMIEHAFGDLGFEQVVAATDRPNKASLRVMERAGLARWKHTDEGLNGTIYCRLTRDEWVSARQRRSEC